MPHSQHKMPGSITPLQIAGYNILPLSLPPLPSFPTATIHYLYLAPHQPKIPVATASRSLFLVNVPFDATDKHIKHMLSAQIGLPAGRIEDVQFEGPRKSGAAGEALSTQKPAQKSAKKGKKRKRESDGGNLENMEGAALPSTWDRDLQTSGLTAVVMFVDRASMDAALKTVKAIGKENTKPDWGDGVDDKIPALGSASKSFHRQLLPHQLTWRRISQPPSPYVSRQSPTSRIRQQLHDSIWRQRGLSVPTTS